MSASASSHQTARRAAPRPPESSARSAISLRTDSRCARCVRGRAVTEGVAAHGGRGRGAERCGGRGAGNDGWRSGGRSSLEIPPSSDS
eukprot:2757675-Pleurochrysis_carterae.AAC.2